MIIVKFIKGFLVFIGFMGMMYFIYVYLLPNAMQIPNLPLINYISFNSYYTNPFIYGGVSIIAWSLFAHLDMKYKEE